jgi:hypothetical protein
LPDQLTANASACPGGSGSQPFNAPQSWDGTCDGAGPISSASSLTVAPPTAPLGNCAPVTTGSKTIQGETAAQICNGLVSVAPGTCGDQAMVCAFPKADGFLTCITHADDQQCPDGWPTRHVVFLDEQTCGCQCGSPVGDSCSATVTVYGDSACSEVIGSVMVSSDTPAACADVPPGSPFGSKSSTPPVYKAGTCAPMAANLGAHLTYCCAL